MRAATALIGLFSILSAPFVSMVCRDCCNRSVAHQLTLCHDKAHANLGSLVHHMHHVHMVTQDSDASAVIKQCSHQLHDSRLSCQTAVCVSAKPVQASVAPVAGHLLKIPRHLPATTICSSLPAADSDHSPDVCRIEIDSSLSASVPLRI